MVLIKLSELQILFFSIESKTLKMLWEKFCLHFKVELRRVAHPIRAGVEDGSAYHKKINKSLNVNTPTIFAFGITLYTFFTKIKHLKNQGYK